MDLFQIQDFIETTDQVKSCEIYAGETHPSQNLITIAIPTYKRSSTLKDTLDSALSQVGSNQYRILVIDNNPERGDETELLMERYRKESIISYYKNEENVGMMGNWNKLFLLANTPWVVMLHDDDILSPYYIKTITEYLRDDITFLKPEIPKFYNDIVPVFSAPRRNADMRRVRFTDFLCGCAIGSPSHIVFNRSCVLRLGGWNMEHFPCSDYIFNIKASLYGKVYKLPVVLGAYRVSANESLKISTMEQYFRERFFISKCVFRKLKVPVFVFNFIKYFCFSLFVEDINAKYKMSIKPRGVCYVLPSRIQTFILSNFYRVLRTIWTDKRLDKLGKICQ